MHRARVQQFAVVARFQRSAADDRAAEFGAFLPQQMEGLEQHGKALFWH